MQNIKATNNSPRGDEARRFGRVPDVERNFGLKRTTLYALLKAGKIRGCSIMVSGKTSKIRLIDLASVETFIQSQITNQGRE
jgi:hypothetical protein